MWAEYYKISWGSENKVICVRWGTEGFESAEHDRPQFRGDTEEPRRRSPVTNHMETYFPESKRTQRQILSLFVVVLAIGVLLVFVAATFYLDYYLDNVVGLWYSVYITSLITALQIRIFSNIYNVISRALNDYENHRTDTAYEDSLIFKTFLFQTFNNYAALFYTAFFRSWTFGCDDILCINRLEILLFFIFAVRFLLVFWNLLGNQIILSFKRFLASLKRSSNNVQLDDDEDGLNPAGEYFLVFLYICILIVVTTPVMHV